MFKTFIERPVLSTVISIVIVLLGLLGLMSLPISQYPEIAPPTVRVSATYTGANANVILRNVVIPLEEQINGVEGMTYITSTATNDGAATITVYFKLGTNPDIDAVNVQNQVSRASPLLPAEVTRSGVIVSKQQSSNLIMFALKSENPDYDQTFLNNYANINLVPVIQRIYGVGGVNVFGSKDYSMRIWLKPDVMAAYGLTPDDVSAALAEQNIDAAPGKFGENSNQVFQYTINYTGRLIDTTQFGDIVMRATANGQLLRLRDIARIELGSLTYASVLTADNKPATVIAVSQTAGSNAQQIIKETIKTLDQASASFPVGISYLPLFNVNDFLNASIEKVVETLVEAYILVFLVVFIFLQDFRSTLIPGIAVLVSIVGTFMVLNLLGFTLNLLTLFALVLAIGIVVDDAIVVVEAVHAKLDEGYTSSLQASIDAMHELSTTIVAITLVMSAVFIPVSFIGGSSGVFFQEFGLTLAASILISAVNALTLSPALCAVFLSPHTDEPHKRKSLLKRFYTAFNTGFDAVKNKYQRSIGFLSRHKWLVPSIVILFTIALVFFMKAMPSGFVPNEDQGVLFADITLAPGTSLEQSTAIASTVDSISRTIDAVTHTAKISGQSLLNGTGSNNAMVIIRLKNWKDRKGIDIDQVSRELMAKTAGIRDGRIIFFAPPTVPGFGISSGFNIELQDKTGGDIGDFFKVAGSFLATLNQRPEILYATTGFNPNYPQYLMSINVPRCKQSGVDVSSILSTMQGYYGGVYASNFNVFGKQYRVMVQAYPTYRSDLEGLNKIYVRTGNGSMAPINSFITMTKVFGPQSISRFNLFTNISVFGSPKPGFSTGDAINAVKEVAAKSLPAGYSYEYSGLTREEVSAGSKTIFIYALCVVFVYFLLSALYESYIIPLAVLLSLPVGLFGTYLFGKLRGLDNNIYLQISVIMLIGLLAKNAILIVEYAVARRKKGMSIVDAAVEGATARLRPILMTSLAFIFGLMPLMVASGVGAAGNRSIGTGAVGGMVVGTIVGVFVIPVLYIIFQTLQEKISGPPKLPPTTTKVLLLLLALSAMMPSCLVRKNYQRPSVPTDSIYRDPTNYDTTTIATLSWKELFTDTTLQGLIAEAIRNNYDLKAAVARVRQAEAGYRQSKAAFFPTLSVNPQVGYQEVAAAQGGGFIQSNRIFQLGGSSNWEADLWGKLTGAKQAALATLLSSDASRRAVQTQLIAGVVSDYYNLLALDKQLEITRQTVQVRTEDVETNKALKEGNKVTGAAVVQSEANRYAAEVTIPDLMNSIRQTENDLSVLTGRRPGPVSRSSLDAQSPVTSLQTGIPIQLLSNRPDVQAAEYNLRIYFEQINVARAYFYPAFTITASGGWQSFNVRKLFDYTSLFASVFAGLTQPIFNQGLNRQRMELANAQYEENLATFQKTILTAGQEVSDALYNYQSAIDKANIRLKQLSFLQKSVDYTRELLKYGYATYTDVLTSEQSLLAAQLSSINDKLQQLTAIVTLYRSLGGGWR